MLENKRPPVDIRRTALVVRDFKKSLPLYCDALGLKVVYDQLIGGGNKIIDAMRRLRFILAAR